MNKSEQISTNETLEVIKNWNTDISLTEIIQTIQDKLGNTLVKDLPKEALDTIRKLKAEASEEEIKRFQKIEEYLQNISHLTTNPGINSLQEANWKTYLVLGKKENNEWDQESEIYEVIEQRWVVYIWYHPLKEKYVAYRYYWEESNICLLNWFYSFEETDIDWCYKLWATKKDKYYQSYYYISKDWENTRWLGYFNIVWDLEQVWNTILFRWRIKKDNEDLIVAYNPNTQNEPEHIPNWASLVKRSKSGKNLLWVQYNFANDKEKTKHTLYDLDNMQFVFKKADEFEFELSEKDSNIIENEISWKITKPRKLFWQKTIDWGWRIL